MLALMIVLFATTMQVTIGSTELKANHMIPAARGDPRRV